MERVVVAGVGIHPFGRFDADYRQIGAVAARGALDAEGFAALAREVAATIERAVAWAEASPPSPLAERDRHVYAESDVR